MSELTTDDWVDVPSGLPDRSRQPESHNPENDKAERSFYTIVADAALARLESNNTPIFTVDLQDVLWSDFLNHLDPSLRQQFSCTTCKRFVTRYGGLVQVADDGCAQPLLWPSTDETVPEHLRTSIRALHRKVSSASVLGEFKITAKVKSGGARTCGGYNHFYLDFPDARLYKSEPIGFTSASVGELASMLSRVIEDFSLDTVQRAALILTENKLPYADNHTAAMQWLLDLRDNKKVEKGSEETARHNLLYRYAASSFKGCLNQLRSGALSTLLEDIEAGKDFDAIKKRWLDICDPLHYLRPQAAPKVTHIAAAERLMESLGVTEHDMRRRQLTLSEVPEPVVIWAAEKRRPEQTANPDGIFSKLKPRGSPQKAAKNTRKLLEIPSTRISFTKLMTEVLPKATKLEYKLGLRNGIFFCLTGLEGTKPLMQWHNEQNKASWFVYHHPHPVQKHNLLPDAWNKASCIIPLPHLWDGVPQTTTFPLASAKSNDFRHYHKSHGVRYLLCLENVKLDEGASLCLFPALLKSEFHGIRRTIEAYSGTNCIEKVSAIEEKGGLVAGVTFGRSESMEGKHLLRVTDERGAMNTYEIVLFE